MTRQIHRQRHRRGETLNLPPSRSKTPEVDHGPDHGDRAHVHVLEGFEDLGHFLEEVGVLGFFGGGAPFHVDAEHVGEKREVEVEGEAAEELRWGREG